MEGWHYIPMNLGFFAALAMEIFNGTEKPVRAIGERPSRLGRRVRHEQENGVAGGDARCVTGSFRSEIGSGPNVAHRGAPAQTYVGESHGESRGRRAAVEQKYGAAPRPR